MSSKIFSIFFKKKIQFIWLYPHRTIQKCILFTKAGDTGKTSLYTDKIYKDHLIFEAIGTTEELSAFIGLAKEFVREDQKLLPLEEKLGKVQLVLVDIVDILTSLHPLDSVVDETKVPNPPSVAKVTAQDITELETLISYYETLMPPAEKIIIPGGGKASAALHLSKSVCRRCERVLVTIFKNMDHEKKILMYINRLSTYLCQAARICAKFAVRPETVYRPQLKEKQQ